jgi:hypothetical protein
MEPVIILTSVNIILTTSIPIILPLIIAGAFFVKNIKRSSCCLGSVEMREKDEIVYGGVSNDLVIPHHEEIKNDI